MHSTGDYVSSGSDFSSKWLATIEFYIDKIQNDLTSDNWNAIFDALHHLEESDRQGGQIQNRAPPVLPPREALLPDDPLTPPPMDIGLPYP
jgi:hypothetical protein